MHRRNVTLVVALGALGLAACGSGGQAADHVPPATVANVGALPMPRRGVADEAAATTAATTTAADAASSSSSTEPPAPADTAASSDFEPAHIGDLARGNRLLIVGDSIMFATGDLDGGPMCAELAPRGWEVAMDAAPGRHIDVGASVVEREMALGDWDAVVIALGSNYDGEEEIYAGNLDRIIRAAAPRPVLLVTVTEFEEDRTEVNYILREAAVTHDDVRVLEWAERTRLDDSLTGDDGLHLSDRGKAVLVAMVGVALGDAPGSGFGACVGLSAAEGGNTVGSVGGG